MAVHENSEGQPMGVESSSSDALKADQIPEEVLAGQNTSLVQRLLPWVVSISIVGWLLWPYRVPEQRALLSNAFAQADRWVIVVSFAGAVVIWLTDAYATARTLQRWGTAISLGETCLIRGATLLFDAINPTLGQAVLTLVVYRRGSSLGQAILLVMLMNVIFIVHIAVISGAGLLTGAAPEAGLTTWLVGIALGSTALYLAIVAIRPAALAKNPTLRWLMDAGLSGHAWAFLYRLPNMVVLIVAQVFVMRCFNIDVPWGVSLLYLPALFFIVGMPISVQGLGPGQVASVSFFSAYTPGDAATAEATILACGFAGAALTTLNAIVIGMCCLTTRTGRDSVAAVRSARKR
jgi:hypothetical protein